MDTIDRAAAALGFADWKAMSAALYLMGASEGFVLADVEQRDRLDFATREDLAVGAIIAVYGHQAVRVARVWAVTPSKVSAVYLTPTAVERSQRWGGDAVPNNITAKIADVRLVALAPETEHRVEREAAEAPAPVGGGSALVTDDADDAYSAGMLPLAGADGFLF